MKTHKYTNIVDEEGYIHFEGFGKVHIDNLNPNVQPQTETNTISYDKELSPTEVKQLYAKGMPKETKPVLTDEEIMSKAEFWVKRSDPMFKNSERIGYYHGMKKGLSYQAPKDETKVPEIPCSNAMASNRNRLEYKAILENPKLNKLSYGVAFQDCYLWMIEEIEARAKVNNVPKDEVKDTEFNLCNGCGEPTIYTGLCNSCTSNF